MDLSVSYHPISQEQMKQWYFDAFEDMGVVSTLKLRVPDEQLKEHTLEDVESYYMDKYKSMISRSRELEYDNFNKWHAYFLAITQGFFEKFYFVHGCAISSILDKEFHDTYVSDWTKVVPREYIEDLHVTNKLQGAFSGGVYLCVEQVKKLLNDYENDSLIKEIMDEQFEGKKIEVILEALKYASENNQGLLEATKVIDQSDEIFQEPSCFSNLFNCDVLSAAVYTKELADHYDEIYKGTGD